jgi:hypothetical protein
MSLRNAFLAATALALVSTAAQAETITIATVNNGDMIRMQGLTDDFTAKTGHTVEWVTLEENVLRQRVTTDITTKGGQFDILTIGMYETPIWGANGWLIPLDNLSEDYDVGDILPAMAGGLSHDGKLYAAPFYGESSMIMYRTDLMEKAGHGNAGSPTWEFIREAAAAMTDRDNDINGICLRGKAGWGEGGAFITVTWQLLRCALVRRGLERPVRSAGVEGSSDLLRRDDGRVGSGGLCHEWLQREPVALPAGQVRHVDRRHRGGVLRDQPERFDRRRQGRLRTRAEP